MASIRCAHCKEVHGSVAEVKACAGVIQPRENRPANPNDPLWSQYESYIAENFPHVEVDRSKIERQEDFNCWKDRHGPRQGPRADKALPAGHRAYRYRDRGWNEVKRLRRLVPAGHFAVKMDDRWRFYRIDKPTEGRWAGYTFVKVQASDDYWPVKGQQKLLDVLGKIAEDPRAAAIRYGKEIGRCAICNRTLTNDDTPGPDGLTSIERGIGPICASKMGW